MKLYKVGGLKSRTNKSGGRIIKTFIAIAIIIAALQGSALAAEHGKLVYSLDKKTKDLTAVIIFDGAFEYKTFKLDTPPRYIIDITPVVLPDGGVRGGETFDIGTKSVKTIRLAQFSRNPDIARIVIDTTEDMDFNIEKNEKYNKLVIMEGDGPDAPAAAKLPKVTTPEVSRQSTYTQLLFKVGQKDAGFAAAPVYNPDGSFSLKISFPGFTTADAGKTIPLGKGIADSLSFKKDGKTTYAIVHAKVPTGYKVEYMPDGQTLAVTIRQPSVAGQLICIDPGHGGKDPGAIGPDGTKEKTVALDVGLRLRRLLRAAGANVIMTREDDTFIPLPDRTYISNTAGCKVFLSIHCNALPNHDARQHIRGSQTYYYSDSSKDYAVNVLAEMEAIMGLGETGAHARSLYVTRNSVMPAVLAEIAFVSQRKDLALLRTPEFRENTARGLYNGLEVYLGLNGDRLPAVKLPDAVASYVLHKPRLPEREFCVAQNPDPDAADGDIQVSAMDDTDLFPRRIGDELKFPKPVQEIAAPTDAAKARAMQPRAIQKYPKEPWNVKSVTGTVSLNK